MEIVPAVVVVGGATAGALIFSQPTKAVIDHHSAETTTQTSTPNAVGSGYLAELLTESSLFSGRIRNKSLSGTAHTHPGWISTQPIGVHADHFGNRSSNRLDHYGESFNGGASVFGTLSGGSFTVELPQHDGSLAPITFRADTAHSSTKHWPNSKGTQAMPIRMPQQEGSRGGTAVDQPVGLNGQRRYFVSLQGLASTLSSDKWWIRSRPKPSKDGPGYHGARRANGHD